MTVVPPLRRELVVAADPNLAFRVFTEQIGNWWPLGAFSVFGAGSRVGFEGEQIVEIGPGGERAVWGTVTSFEPGRSIAFMWHPGGEPEGASQVSVRFVPQGASTLVTLVHTGWEHVADPAAARAEYDRGWPAVLDHYRDEIWRHDPEGASTWVALLHRPGPAAPVDGTLFADERFAEHVAFLERMHDRGYLVAAGPFPEAQGEGMTVVRLPGPGRLDDAERLAREDDASVAGGFLAVTVREWRVMLHS